MRGVRSERCGSDRSSESLSLTCSAAVLVLVPPFAGILYFVRRERGAETRLIPCASFSFAARLQRTHSEFAMRLRRPVFWDGCFYDYFASFCFSERRNLQEKQ